MTLTETPATTGSLRTGAAAALIGCRPETLARWTAKADDRGTALRRCRIARGYYSLTRLREAGFVP